MGEAPGPEGVGGFVGGSDHDATTGGEAGRPGGAAGERTGERAGQSNETAVDLSLDRLRVMMAAEGVVAQQAGDAVAGPVLSWPCANCGRPVPQEGGRDAQLVRYCQDNDGACEDAARGRTERGRRAPGLTGDVARTWEIVQRMEQMAGLLAGSLSSELGVAGVERRVAEARAEAATCIAVAQEEREAAERQAEAAWREAAAARVRAEAAAREAAEARAEAERAGAAQAEADKAHDKAKRQSERDRAARLAAESERDRVAAREGELLSGLETARSELVDLHSRLAEAESAAESKRQEAETAKQAAEDVRHALAGAQTQLQRVIDERDQLRSTVREHEQQVWNISRSMTELQAAVATLTAERDAARAEADRARRRVDELTASGSAPSFGATSTPLGPPANGRPPGAAAGPPSSSDRLVAGGPGLPPPATGRPGGGRIPMRPLDRTGLGLENWSKDDPLFGGPGVRPSGGDGSQTPALGNSLNGLPNGNGRPRANGYQGTNGGSGLNGHNGYHGHSGTNGHSATNGHSGTNGHSATDAGSGPNGVGGLGGLPGSDRETGS